MIGTFNSIIRHDFIRSLENYVTLSIAIIKGIIIHILNIYFPTEPQEDISTKAGIIRWVEWVIQQRILASNKHEFIIVAGDFNQKLNEFQTMLKKYDINQTLADSEITHERGNKLNELFNNIPIKSHKFISDPCLSDHKAIVATLCLDLNRP